MISTIIPVYNSEKYINKCIDSIINQTIGFNNIELIIVDDGSTDNSKKIIKSYQKKYKNIKYIYQENSGQASARNNGLSLASGDYISFVDSDDWLDVSMYEKMIKNIKNCDIIFCNFLLVYPTYSIERKMSKYKNLKHDFLILNTGPCNMLLKKNFLDKVNFKFPEGIIYEDLASIPPLAVHTNKINYLDEALYNYSQLGSSTVRRSKYSTKVLNIYKSLEIYELNMGKYKEKYYNELEYIYIYNLILLAGGGFVKYEETKNELKHIKNIMKEKFPNWKKNPYYKQERFLNKIKINLLYNNHKLLYKILMKLQNIFNKMRGVL